jgi:tetrahydromethanopterin S-methyltransferase subunit F
VYTGLVETARANNRLGLPLGAAYLREASRLMRGTLLPAARDVSAQANARLTEASGQATGLPLALVLLVVTAVLCYVLYRAQRWLMRRTNRRLNPGLVVASVAGVVALLWLAVAFAVARSDLLEARNHGSDPVAALAQADIAALQARADESLTLIDAGGDDTFEADFKAVEQRLGPGPGTLLTNAVTAARGSPGADSASAAARAATAWYAAHRTVRSLDDNGKHTQAVKLVTTPGPDHSGTLFTRLDSALTAAIAANQVVFRTNAVTGRDAFTGLEIGVIVLALVMAAGCARGLSTRLAEYR